MANDAEFLAFAEYVRCESLRIGLTAKRHPEEASQAAMMLCSQAARKKRELLGLPEPDPDVDYDPDYHADGTERLPNEPRREKGTAFSDGLNLADLMQQD